MKKFRGIILIVLLIVLGLVVYRYSLNHLSNSSEEDLNVSEVGKLVNRNLETDYPNTPRKVIEYYSQIMKYFYEEGISDDILEKLVTQSRKLYDEELLAANPDKDAFDNAKDYIKGYQEQNKKITDYRIEDSKDVEYYTKEGTSYAIVTVLYFTRDKSEVTKTYEDYLLKRDEHENWKILGWELTQKVPEKEE